MPKDNIFGIKVKDNGVKKIYATNVKVSVEKSNTEEFIFKIRKVSEGRNKNKATENATKVDYRYSIKGSTLKLNAFFYLFLLILNNLLFKSSNSFFHSSLLLGKTGSSWGSLVV